MGDRNRKAGLLVGGIFISLALVFLLISIGVKHIGVVKRDTLSEQEGVSSYTEEGQVDESVWGTNESNGHTVSDNTGTETSEQESAQEQEPASEQEPVKENPSEGTIPEETQETKSQAITENPTGVASWTEINESSIDYNVLESSADGVVISKKVYLTEEGTLVYCLGIECRINNELRVLPYYCGYSAYSNVSENDLVSVKYKKPTDSTIMISRVEVN